MTAPRAHDRRRQATRLALPACGIAAVLAGCGGGGDDRLPSATVAPAALHLRVSSPAFIDGARLQRRYTCDGAGDEPVVRAGGVPAGADELVLVVSDPDAPGGTFVHLTRYGLEPGGDGSVDHGGREGRNSAGDDGWTPPCPPDGDGRHRYVWSVYALRDPTGLPAGAAPAEVTKALDTGLLASGTITATYSRGKDDA
jgi:Raf kinase inhibitor-like YbhB/YbcL family protein